MSEWMGVPPLIIRRVLSRLRATSGPLVVLVGALAGLQAVTVAQVCWCTAGGGGRGRGNPVGGLAVTLGGGGGSQDTGFKV